MRTLFLSALAALAFLTPARAWDPDGHLIVATIAYDNLNPKAREAAKLLAPQVKGPGAAYDPITIACWMDDLRAHEPADLPYRGLFFPWHYVDLGLAPGDPEPVIEPGHDNETSGNALTALKRADVVLRGGTDPYITSKAMAYAIAVHIIGDIHQPLHAGEWFHRENGRWQNDAGGNKVAILNGPTFEKTYNLHWFWDAAWRAGFDDATGLMTVDTRHENWNQHNAQTVEALAHDWEKSFKPAAGVGLEPDFEGWAKESNAVVREMVYPRLTFTEGHKTARISAAYVAMANPLARQRITLAGYRLAAYLNATLGAEKPGGVPASYPPGPPAQLKADQTIPVPKTP